MIPMLISFFFPLWTGSQAPNRLGSSLSLGTTISKAALLRPKRGQRNIQGKTGLSTLSEVSSLRRELTIEEYVIEISYHKGRHFDGSKPLSFHRPQMPSKGHFPRIALQYGLLLPVFKWMTFNSAKIPP